LRFDDNARHNHLSSTVQIYH